MKKSQFYGKNNPWICLWGLFFLLAIFSLGFATDASGYKSVHKPGLRKHGSMSRQMHHYNWMMARRKGGPGWKQKKRYHEWESLPPEKRRLLKKRLREWQQLSPSDRALLRRRFEQWKRLPPEERLWIKQRLKHWNELSPEEREMIRRKFLGE